MTTKPFEIGQRVHCRYETDGGTVLTDHGIVRRVRRISPHVNGNHWRIEVRDLPGRSGVAPFFLPALHATAIKAAGFPPLSKAAMRSLAKQARKYGYYRNGTEVWLDCPRCRKRVELTFSQYSGTLAKQLDEAVIRHLSDDEACAPEGGFR